MCPKSPTMADAGGHCPTSRKVFIPYVKDDKHCRSFVLEILTDILDGYHYEYIIEFDYEAGKLTLGQYIKFVEECPFVIMPLCKSTINELLDFINIPKNCDIIYTIC